jgi:hypothetical protein
MAHTTHPTQEAPHTLNERKGRYIGRQTAILAQIEALTIFVKMHGEQAAARAYPWDLIGDLGHIRTQLNALLVENAP